MGNSAAKSGQSKCHRRIYVGNVPEIDDHTQAVKENEKSKRKRKFASNRIVTSRYTLLTFVPKAIFEQFHRFVNIYFLAVVLLQALSDSPVSPASTGAAFAFVVGASVLKQAYEDWLRHKADAVLNNKKVRLVKDGRVQELKSQDIKVGDILQLVDNEQVPADLLVLGSSDDQFRCQITTVNLDGETNFKVRYSPSGLPNLKSDSDLLKFRTILECEEPNSNLYAFTGTLFLPKSVSVDSDERNAPDETSRSIELNIGNEKYLQLPVSIENVVLRGTTLKNTDFIYGLVVYTGQDTRLSQNSKKAGTKFSTVEKAINTFLMAIIVILIALITTCTVLYFVLKDSDSLNPDNAAYLLPHQDNDFGHIFHIVSSFFVLFNYIIPISLYVTIELQKFFGSLFFVWDKDLYDPVTDQAPLCNTSDLNEELGQIEYLFSDKTGTLTENIMKFQYCSVNGVRYDFNSSEQKLCAHTDNDKTIPERSEEMKNFLKVLALSHTVQFLPLKPRKQSVDSNENTDHISPAANDDSEYHASSPDEKALLEAASKLGVKYLGESESVLTLNQYGQMEKYKRLLVLEFDADRKCMSVIVEDSQGDIWLFTKGAESAILPKCVDGPKSLTLDHVNEFAEVGMRTLVIAQKKLSSSEFESFITKMNTARRLVLGREEAVRELYISIESDLTVVGATGVEDQLQSGVTETLEALSAAGIHVWVLTGDKLETAINVAVSCGLMSSDKSLQIVLANCTKEDAVAQQLNIMLNEANAEKLATSCFVLDGETLETAFQGCPDLLRDVAMKAAHVVCCRMAPLQKAQIVRMVKNSPGHPVTAAVGDGANDVAMIQEAHIGLGILGKEGRQAARCSDFAVARFSFLKKTILVHGHWYYHRLAVLVLYFFYKNIVFILPPAFAAIFSAFSSQTLFNPFYLTTFNLFYSSAPILAIGLQDQPIPSDKLLNSPKLYRNLRKNQFLSWLQFWSWILQGVWHALLAFFVPFFAWSYFAPLFNDWASFGMFIITAVVALTNMQLVTETKYNTILVFITHGLSYLGFFVFTSIYAEVDLKGILRPRELYHAFWTIQSHPGFWFTIILITAMGLLPDMAWKAFWNTIRNRRPADPTQKQA